jgi:hypothetical protein
MTARGISLWAASLLGAVGQAQTENPDYAAWASFRTGSTVLMGQRDLDSGVAVEAEVLYTMLDVSDQKVVLQVNATRYLGETKTELPAERLEIHSLIPKESLTASTREGIEEILADGKRLMCRWREIETAGLRVRTWTAAEVPGGRVRRQITVPGTKTSVTLLEIVRWNAAS